MLQANKSKKYEIKESEKGFYHILITRRTLNEELKKYDTNGSIQIFDTKGYKQFKDFMPADISEAEIIHDPVLQRKSDAEVEAKKNK